MKSCDEITKEVLARRDVHNEKIKKRNRMIVRIGVPTVSLCLAVIVGIGFMRSDDSNTAADAIIPGIKDVVGPGEYDGSMENAIGTVSGDYKPLTDDVNGGKDECPEEGDEIWIEPLWCYKSPAEQYPEFDFGGTKYTTAATWIESDSVGDFIGNATAVGHDIYSDKTYETNICIYQINGIATEAAIAVCFDIVPDEYAVYTDHLYTPETLGDFIKALSLRENLTFDTIYHTFWEYESYMTTEYKINDPKVIWDMLLSDTSLRNVANEVTDEKMSHYKESMSVGVNVDILGVKNVSLSITENGYISTNILATRKLFYIGEDKAQQFFDYVRANFENVREEPASTTAVTAPAEPWNPEDTVIVQTSPAYNPEIMVIE